MNAVIRAVVRTAVASGLEVIGIERGFAGLIEQRYVHLNARSVSGIINRGGTILKTVRCAEIKSASGMKRAVDTLKEIGVDGLVIIGGDGSLAAGNALSKHGVNVVNIPASIDNDVYGTDETVGFDTALDTAVDAVDKIRDTATSHERIFIVEVMGREHGFLALSIGVAAGAEFVLIPEMRYDLSAICGKLKEARQRGKTSLVMIFAEGAGNPQEFASRITKRTGFETRVSALGYIQRGGTPTGRSRILASRFGTRAVELLLGGRKNRLVVVSRGRISDIPISTAIHNEKKLDLSFYRMAKELSK